MNVFVVHSGADYHQVECKLNSMKQNVSSLNPLMLENGGVFWKKDAAKKIKKGGMAKLDSFLLELYANKSFSKEEITDFINKKQAVHFELLAFLFFRWLFR